MDANTHRVTPPNGRVALLCKTDLGPSMTPCPYCRRLHGSVGEYGGMPVAPCPSAPRGTIALVPSLSANTDG